MTESEMNAFEEAKQGEMKAYGYQGKPLAWQNGFDKGFAEGWKLSGSQERKSHGNDGVKQTPSNHSENNDTASAWKYRYINRGGNFISPWFPVLDSSVIENLQAFYPQNEYDIEVVSFYERTQPIAHQNSRANVFSKDWVTCPICGEPDMRKELDSEGNALIFCVNYACASNGGSNDNAISERRKVNLVSAFNFAVERAQLVDLINGEIGDMAAKIDVISLAQKIMATRAK